MKTIERKSSESRNGSVSALVTTAIGKNGSKVRAPKQDSEPQKTGEIPPDAILFHRDDWMDLRDPNRISNKAGVAFEHLPKVVVKELCDDALDASGNVEFG